MTTVWGIGNAAERNGAESCRACPAEQEIAATCSKGGLNGAACDSMRYMRCIPGMAGPC